MDFDFVEFKKKYQKQPVEHYHDNITEKPIVSVIVVTFQHFKYIRQCLDGVLMQETSYFYEIILGDDNSTDGTREICIEYAEKYPDKIRLFLHHRANNISIGGAPTGRFNFLYNLSMARGKYIALCDGDDYWINTLKLQKQVELLEKNKQCSMCFTHQLVVNESGDEIQKKEYEEKEYSINDIIKGFIPGTQTMVLRNFENLAVFLMSHTSSPTGDRMLAYYCSLFGHILILPEITAAYRQTGKGVWTTMHKEKQYFFSLEEFIIFHKSIGLPVNNEYIHRRLNGAFFYWIRKKPKSIIKLMKTISLIKNKYNIKSNFTLYFFSKLFNVM